MQVAAAAMTKMPSADAARSFFAPRRLAAAMAMVFLAACGAAEPPACLGAYSSRGDAEAIAELIDEFVDSTHAALENDNLVLLSEAQAIQRAQNLGEMERWVCKVQRLYGRDAPRRPAAAAGPKVKDPPQGD